MKGKQREYRHRSVDTIVTEMTSNSKVSLKQGSQGGQKNQKKKVVHKVVDPNVYDMIAVQKSQQHPVTTEMINSTNVGSIVVVEQSNQITKAQTSVKKVKNIENAGVNTI